jgi:hypothetical protein
MLSIRIVLFGAVVPLLLRKVSLPRLAERLEPRRHPTPLADLAGAEALVRRIDRLLWRAWPLVRRGCLVRGVTRYRFLRQAGFDAVLCFGMGRLEADSRLMGHCWIEQGGRALAEPREPRPLYKEMFRVSPHAAS